MSCRQTGRAVSCKKMTVEDVRSLDISFMHKVKVFKKGPLGLWTASWRSGDKVTSSVGYSVIHSDNLPSALRFQYTITDHFHAGKENLDYQIRVTSTPCHLGGVRWWFICPLLKNDAVCGRRCRILYLPGGARYFGCRECYDLSYESRQKHRLKFYEGFIKPMKLLESLRDLGDRTGAMDRAIKLERKYEKAHLNMQKYFLASVDQKEAE